MDDNTFRFNDLPVLVQEALLWDMELEYDGYESSKAETIHMILCGSDCSSTNELIIKNYWKALSPDRVAIFLDHAVEQINRNRADLDRCRELLKKA